MFFYISFLVLILDCISRVYHIAPLKEQFEYWLHSWSDIFLKIFLDTLFCLLRHFFKYVILPVLYVMLEHPQFLRGEYLNLSLRVYVISAKTGIQSIFNGYKCTNTWNVCFKQKAWGSAGLVKDFYGGCSFFKQETRL